MFSFVLLQLLLQVQDFLVLLKNLGEKLLSLIVVIFLGLSSRFLSINQPCLLPIEPLLHLEGVPLLLFNLHRQLLYGLFVSFTLVFQFGYPRAQRGEGVFCVLVATRRRIPQFLKFLGLNVQLFLDFSLLDAHHTQLLFF